MNTYAWEGSGPTPTTYNWPVTPAEASRRADAGEPVRLVTEVERAVHFAIESSDVYACSETSPSKINKGATS